MINKIKVITSFPFILKINFILIVHLFYFWSLLEFLAKMKSFQS